MLIDLIDCCLLLLLVITPALTSGSTLNQSLRPSGFAPAFGRVEPTHRARSRAMNGAPDTSPPYNLTHAYIA
jgi:hypothetical protein